MEAIGSMVRNIAVVILLAAFMEMLLPNSSMRRFVQLVMGLFVLMAVLGPVLQLINLPLAFEIPAWSQSGAVSQDVELAQVLQQGQNIQEQSWLAAAEEYKKAMERQVKALALTVKGVDKVSVDLAVKTTGEVESLKVYVGEGESSIQPVLPVSGLDKPREAPPQGFSSTQEKIAKDLQVRLGTLLGVAEEKIEVSFK